MRIPSTPPDIIKIFSDALSNNKQLLLKLVTEVDSVDGKQRYLHWDELKHRTPPDGLTSEQWWAGMKRARKSLYQYLPFTDTNNNQFHFSILNKVSADLHWLDMNAGGVIKSDEGIINPYTKAVFFKRSLEEEAINSSLLEGAVTTRHEAKKMIRSKREPRDKSEQMILNNYHAMQFINENRDEKLTSSMVLELHRIVTEKTFETESKSGAFRAEKDIVEVVDNSSGEVLHTPPNANELSDRLDKLCMFANQEDDSKFIHPLIKGIILHYVLAYDHPFIDGNGRTARALFYWAAISSGYWQLEFVSISKVIYRAPAKYGRAFLFSETDDNDITYFLLHQVDVLMKAIHELQEYLRQKLDGVRQAEKLLEQNRKLKGKLNFRQLALLRHALKHPNSLYLIKEHQLKHGISYETARKDLLIMSDGLGLFKKLLDGKALVFNAPENLEERIKAR
ncbi:MAG: Fic family protein [Calditrichia bacterium]